MDKKKVVFVCAHNAGKSRVAEAYLKELAGDRVEVSSAGTTPGDAANPAAVEALTDESGHPLKDYGYIRDAIFSRVEDLAKRLEE